MIKPTILRITVEMHHYAIVIGIPGDIKTAAIAVDARFCTITGVQGDRFAAAVAISRHDLYIPAINVFLTPLRDIAPSCRT